MQQSWTLKPLKTHIRENGDRVPLTNAMASPLGFQGINYVENKQQ